MVIKGLQKLTLLDFPGKMACTVFTAGCNFRCPFCHNASLVTSIDDERISEEEFFAFLKKRQGILEGVCVGRNAVVDAGAVVTADVPPDAVVVGNPARFLKWKDQKAADKVNLTDGLR
jgi:hypothetical protein